MNMRPLALQNTLAAAAAMHAARSGRESSRLRQAVTETRQTSKDAESTTDLPGAEW